MERGLARPSHPQNIGWAGVRVFVNVSTNWAPSPAHTTYQSFAEEGKSGF